MNTQKQIFVIVVLFFVLVGGCAAYSVIDLPVRAPDQTEWHHDQSVERGALLFANNCRTCHGIRGQGGVGLPLNHSANPDAQNFQDQDPLILKNHITLLQRTITCGRASTLMPAWLNTNGGSLNQEQIQHLIDLLTDPVDESGAHKDDQGNNTSKGWAEAIEFAHNLNRETVVVVGGDTLDTIAKDHLIGIQELVDLNGIPANQILKQDSTVKLPDGTNHTVRKSNETLAKLADSEHVGAEILAQLNNIPYTINHDTGTFAIKPSPISTDTGLYPGATLKLPEGSQYVIKSGDTLDSISKVHGITPSGITGVNQTGLSTTDPTKELNSERKLKLPQGAVVIVQAGQTTATIATQHGIKPEDLTSQSGQALDATTQLGAGQTVVLPANTEYTIQTGDTLNSVAANHGVTEQALADANGLKPGDPISPQVVINLPKVDAYVVQGQDLEALAKTFSNVTAESLGKAQTPPAPPNAIFAIGKTLALPQDAWGNAPPNTINNGTACVQNAVPQSVFEQIVPSGSPTAAASITPPAQTSSQVTVTSHAQDWTVTADGTDQQPNKGIVSVAKGASVHFVNNTGVHTLTVNGEDNEANWDQPNQAKDITFSQTGEFKITCDIHPQMLATIFVQ